MNKMNWNKAVKDFNHIQDKVTSIINKSGLSDDTAMDASIEMIYNFMQELGYTEDQVMAIEEYINE